MITIGRRDFIVGLFSHGRQGSYRRNQPVGSFTERSRDFSMLVGVQGLIHLSPLIEKRFLNSLVVFASTGPVLLADFSAPVVASL